MDAAANRVKVQISDSGLGLTPEELTRIFAAFAQGDHAANGSGKFGGLGPRLGDLAHAGSPALRDHSCDQCSGRNQGATFSVELPLCSLPTNSTLKPNGVEADYDVRQEAKDARRQHRVLLVEDHLPTCATLTELLTRRRFRVVAASSLREARALAEREIFDILISDIGLPDGSGCELMSELKTRRRIWWESR